MPADHQKATFVNMDQYIQSGIVEAYAMGLAEPEEVARFEQLLPDHPDLQKALTEFEIQLEQTALLHQVPPPEDTWNNIRAVLQPGTIIKKRFDEQQKQHNTHTASEFINIQSVSSNQIKVHKMWRWIFLAVFVLGKVFLGFAIYYYLQYRQATMEIQQIRQQIELRK